MLVFFLVAILLFISEDNAQVRRRRVEVRKVALPVMFVPNLHNYTSVVVGSKRYFFEGGTFFVRSRGGFKVVSAPIGARIRVLPVGFTILRIGGLDYYYYNGVYYNFLPDQNVYVVVEKPAVVNKVTNLKLDQVKLYNGSVINGIFQGATDSTITIRVGNHNQDINITDIISIYFAPTISDSTK